jgi:ABC-type transport system substrate-binding protein
VKLANRYELVRELGRGGMGVVHLARDPMLDRDVAVKLIGQISDDRKQRFLREARVVAKMDHPGIVGVYDLGEHEDGLFFVMPYVQGVNLRQVLAESPLKLRQLVDLGIQAAEALEYSHGLGIVHRDVKPENIMVTQHTADSLRIRLTDFGLAVHATEQRLTTTGALVGTVSYLSPEQVVGNTVDPRVDIYALGTVLYECIAGRTPFKGEMQAVLFRIVHEEPQPLSQLVQDLDPELEQLVHSCLAKEPQLRPQRAADLAAALYRYRAKIADSARGAEALRTIEMKRGTGAVPPPAAPFVGRAKELAELQNRLNLAVGADSQVVMVAGEAGVGKTRLVEELERLAHARQIRVLTGNFNEQHGAAPYQGFCEMLEAHLRRASASGTELLELEDELIALFPILGELRPGRPRPQRGSASPSGEHDRLAVFDVLARALARIAGDEPLLLVFEDLHLATVSIEALQYIARRLGPTRTLLLGTYSSNEVDRAHPITKFVDGFKGNKRFSLVHIDPFTRDEHRSFMATVSLGARIDDTVAQRLYEISEGNPFFTRELFRSLVDTGSISRDASGSYQLSGSGTAVAFDAIPSTIQKAVERRLERLPDELRQVLALASVLGKSFEEHELEAIVDDEVELDEVLDKLVRGGFIEEQRKGRGDRLEFTSGTMREVLYAELPRRKRRGLHRRVAEYLETKHAGRLERVRPQLVHHFEHADLADKVIEHGRLLATAALATLSTDEAIRAARTVLGFVQEDEEQHAIEAEVRRVLARAHGFAGDFDAALAELELALRLHEKLGDAAATLSGHVEAAQAAWDGRRVNDARRWLDKGIKLAHAALDEDALGKLLPLGITVANLRGDASRARELIAEAEQLRTRSSVAAPTTTGGIVRVALAGRAAATEPALAQLVEDVEVLANVFETLLATDEHGNVVPAVAELWEVSDGGKRCKLSLRAGVKWHDGSELTAADVKASLERSVELAPDRVSPAMSAIASVDTSGPRELSIVLRERLPIFPALLTDVRTALAKPTGSGVVGTGPFKLARRDGDKITLARYDGHWRDHPAIEGLEYHCGIAAIDLVAGFRDGRYDITADLPGQALDEIVRDRSLGARTLERPKKNACFVLFNMHSSAVADPNVRAALCDSVAVSDLVWRHLGRVARPATGLIPPGILGHDAGRRRIVLSAERAAELLAGAGITPVKPVTLRAAAHPALVDKTAIRALFEGWAALGIHIEVMTPTVESYLAKIREPVGIDLAVQRWAADYDDPDSFMYALFDSRVGTRRTLCSDPELDRALEEARLEAAPAARASRYRAIEERLLGSHTILPLWHDEDIRAYTWRLRDVVSRPAAPHVDFSALHVSERRDAATSAHTLKVVLHEEITTLDPHLTTSWADSCVLAVAFEQLMREGHGARIEPWLAESLDLESSGRRYRVRLRSDVRFHDGRPLTARDVRYSLERVVAKAPAYYRQSLEPIVGARAVSAAGGGELAGVRILSPRELTIDLEAPLPSLPAILSMSQLSIVPEGATFEGHSYREGCIGSGPFRIVRSEPGRKLELEANPFYWRAGSPRVRSLAIDFNVDAAEAVTRLRAGRCEMILEPVLDELDRTASDRSVPIQRLAVPKLSLFGLVFQTRRGPFADKAAREAVRDAIDVDALARAGGRSFTPARSLLPPGMLGYDPDRPFARGSGARRAELDVSLLTSPRFFTTHARFKNALVEAIGACGIRMDASTTPRYGEALIEQNATYDAYLGGWIADFPDPDTFMYGLLHSTGGVWGPLVGSPKLDAIVDRIRHEIDPGAREALCKDAEAFVAAEALIVPLFHDRFVAVAHPSVRGFVEGIVTQNQRVDFASLWLDD